MAGGAVQYWRAAVKGWPRRGGEPAASAGAGFAQPSPDVSAVFGQPTGDLGPRNRCRLPCPKRSVSSATGVRFRSTGICGSEVTNRHGRRRRPRIWRSGIRSSSNGPASWPARSARSGSEPRYGVWSGCLTGGALLVSNHSGGAMTPDVLVLAPAFYEKLGYDRPLYTPGPLRPVQTPLAPGPCRSASSWPRRERAMALSSGVGLVFPGGDYDSTGRPSRRTSSTSTAAKGYVRTAIQGRCADRAGGVDRRSGDPVVPGSRHPELPSGWVCRRSCTDHPAVGHRLPVQVTSTIPANFLPSKIVHEVLEPIHVVEQFGPEPGCRRSRCVLCASDAVRFGPVGGPAAP